MAQEDTILIKTEPEVAQHEAIAGLEASAIVTINAGNPITTHVLPKTKLGGSSVLQNWLMANPTKYVMHPALLEIKSDDFARLVQFLIEDEYAPKATEVADRRTAAKECVTVYKSSLNFHDPHQFCSSSSPARSTSA